MKSSQHFESPHGLPIPLNQSGLSTKFSKTSRGFQKTSSDLKRFQTTEVFQQIQKVFEKASKKSSNCFQTAFRTAFQTEHSNWAFPFNMQWAFKEPFTEFQLAFEDLSTELSVELQRRTFSMNIQWAFKWSFKRTFNRELQTAFQKNFQRTSNKFFHNCLSSDKSNAPAIVPHKVLHFEERLLHPSSFFFFLLLLLPSSSSYKRVVFPALSRPSSKTVADFR